MKLFPSLPGARHRLLAPMAGALAAGALLLVPSLASADTGSSLTVVGTSDVSDSGLVQNVLQPAFQAAFPQYSFKYTGSATGTAIQSAENGTGGPSMLIVHAASLENQFVQGGFSLNNQPGNALFTNDFVVIGNKTADPAAVSATTPHAAAAAFGKIAEAGFNGTASFVSRGGTNTASGTTVEEHALWALVAQNKATLAPDVSFCTVSDADGGGASPIVGTSRRRLPRFRNRLGRRRSELVPHQHRGQPGGQRDRHQRVHYPWRHTERLLLTDRPRDLRLAHRGRARQPGPRPGHRHP
jgi:tungstate transport system substrate-binding protein